MTDGIRQGKGGPTAINSKLGWLLSGPAQIFAHNCKTVSNLTVAVGVMDVLSSTDNKELATILRRFWDTNPLVFSGIRIPWYSLGYEPLGTQDSNELTASD